MKRLVRLTEPVPGFFCRARWRANSSHRPDAQGRRADRGNRDLPPRCRRHNSGFVVEKDASGSVSDDRFELQKQGYAAAFRNRQVLNSIRSLTTQSIAVTMMQWTGPELHVETVEWTLVKDEASVNHSPMALKGRSGNCSAAAPRLAARSISQYRRAPEP
jgi:hypothetical protein